MARMKARLTQLIQLPPLSALSIPEALKDPASVTARLRVLGDMQVNCLAEEAISCADYHWHREVLLVCQQQTVVWGLTLVPEQTLAAFPQLKTLKCQPLGDFLFGESKWCRESIRFYDFTEAGGILPPEAADLDWWPVLRHSRFTQDTCALDLYELFARTLL